MAHLRDIATTIDKIYQGGCLCRGEQSCLTEPLRQALICHCRNCFQIDSLNCYDSSAWAKPGFRRNSGALLFYHLNGIPKKSVAIGMLDNANGLVIAGQIFVNSHPHWDRLRSHDLPHLDDQLMGKKS